MVLLIILLKRRIQIKIEIKDIKEKKIIFTNVKKTTKKARNTEIKNLQIRNI